MLIPDRDKKVRTWKIPKIVVHAGAFLAALLCLLLTIVIYDYWRVLSQIYENKYLAAENHQLREQVQVFQMKLNTLVNDLERIHIFEKKLRIISGLGDTNPSQGSAFESAPVPASNQGERDLMPGEVKSPTPISNPQGRFPQGEQDNSQPTEQLETQSSIDANLIKESEETLALLKSEDMASMEEVNQLEDYYQRKLAEGLGIQMGMAPQGPLGEFFQRLIKLGPDLAIFDFKYSKLKKLTADIEVRLSDLDQFLLDRESFLQSMPTILPSPGWLTSFYGPRISPISRLPRFHERP